MPNRPTKNEPVLYRHLPHKVLAMQYTGTVESADEISDFCPSVVIHRNSPTGLVLSFDTLHGPRELIPGNFILKDERGNFDVMEKDDFKRRYEPV